MNHGRASFRVGVLEGYRQGRNLFVFVHMAVVGACASLVLPSGMKKCWGCLLASAGEEVGFGKKHLGIQFKVFIHLRSFSRSQLAFSFFRKVEKATKPGESEHVPSVGHSTFDFFPRPARFLMF